MSVTNDNIGKDNPLVKEGKVCVIQRILITRIYPNGDVHQQMTAPKMVYTKFNNNKSGSELKNTVVEDEEVY